MKYRGFIEVFLEVESPDEHQAEEDMAFKLIHMIRNDEVAINLWPLPQSTDTSRTGKE